jgi:parallel beta-helix repeat protein
VIAKLQRSARYLDSRYTQLLCLALCAALFAACTSSTPQAPPQPAQPVAQALPQASPAALAALAQRVSPCAQAGAPGTTNAAAAKPATPATQPPAAQEVANPTVVHYDPGSNTILLRRGARTTLAGVSRAIERPEALRELAPGEWLLGANLRIEAGAALRIAAPEVRWLKLRSDDQGFVWIKALGGQLMLADTCVSSWDAARKGYDENYAEGRSFILARDGARMEIERSDLRYLGYDGPESYGIAWRTQRTTGTIVDSFVSHNFYGLYTYEVADLVIRGNETAYNIMYGIDPHTRSMRLVIENNVAHDNGKHGIILAQECSDSVIRGNVAFSNLHHGIVLFERSNNNLVEGNTVYSNGGQGINVNDAANNTVRNNTVYDNLEAGIGVGQSASKNQLVGNTVRGNRHDGVSFYSDAADNGLRGNTIDGNARYGVYVKSEGKASIEGNRIAGNLVGIYLNMAEPLDISRQSNQIVGNRDADVRTGSNAASSADSMGDQP